MTCNYEFETIYISTQKPYFGENYNATSTKQVDQKMVRNMISAAFLWLVFHYQPLYMRQEEKFKRFYMQLYWAFTDYDCIMILVTTMLDLEYMLQKAALAIDTSHDLKMLAFPSRLVSPFQWYGVYIRCDQEWLCSLGLRWILMLILATFTPVWKTYRSLFAICMIWLKIAWRKIWWQSQRPSKLIY